MNHRKVLAGIKNRLEALENNLQDCEPEDAEETHKQIERLNYEYDEMADRAIDEYKENKND